jgi:hypothetical protein
MYTQQVIGTKDIMRQAQMLFDEKELNLVIHLITLVEDNKYDHGLLILDIIPTYWENVGDRQRTIGPRDIYRPLYYVHLYGKSRNFKKNTRVIMTNLSGHLEGCLHQLMSSKSVPEKLSKSFGVLVESLYKSDILSDELANDLWEFNRIANIPSKHFNAFHSTQWLDERTFSVEDAIYAFILTRHLSIQLFTLLESRGVNLPHLWPSFRDDWLTLFPLIDESISPSYYEFQLSE